MDIQKQLGILVEQGRWMAQELGELRREVKDLGLFKARVMGMAVLVSFLATLIIELARAKG